jgi:hypothetical protein
MTYLLTALFLLASLAPTVQAATTITFDDALATNPNYYLTADRQYYVKALSADVNTLDLIHGAPAPSLGIPVPHSTQTYMDMGVEIESRTIGVEFHWDEVTLFGDPLYGTEYWIHGVDFDERDKFTPIHLIVRGVQIVATPKADAEITSLRILALPSPTNPTRLGMYGAVDNIKVRAKGEKLPDAPKKKRVRP